MARALRDQTAGGVYHVSTRQNLRRTMFVDDDDRSRFLSILELVLRRYGWQMYAYCLMTTHYHLLFRTPKPNLARGMQLLNGMYAQTFNKKYAEATHVLGHRYSSTRIESEEHVFAAVAYIAFNPVRAGLCERPEGWPWSSYGAAHADEAAAARPQIAPVA